MNNTELAQLLKDGINDGDSDVIWFVIGELEKADTHCEECDNGTDTPCTPCLWEESTK